MRLHLPFSLRKSVLSSLVSMVALSLGSGSACAVTGSEPQNLVFDGATLTWNTNTENKAFTNAAGESASFAPGDNVTFASDASVSLGEDISAGQINITSGADVVIELADNGLNFDTLSMLGGSLDAGDSLNIAAGETLAVGSNGSVLKSDLVLEKNAGLSVDYAGTGSATSLNNSALSLQGGTRFQLSGCGSGDGKTYTLFTGVSELRDSQGNAISLVKGNNAISKYFDTSQPGTGFWAGARLELTNDGTLRLIRHEQVVKEAVKITTRQTNDLNYQCHERVTIENVLFDTSASYAHGGAVHIVNSYTSVNDKGISMNNNGTVMFSNNCAWGHGAFGGAVRIDYGNISMNSNGSVIFSQNRVEDIHENGAAWGGAINCRYGDITLNDNGSVIFADNQSITGYHTAGGGAIEIWGGNLTIKNNGQVCFRNNSAEVLFSGGYGSGDGGAIFQGSGSFYLCNNEEVEFTGNRSQSSAGAAIRTQGDLYIHNNGRVLFENNVEVAYDGSWSYRLRSIYSSGDVLSLSAGEDNSIEFRDSVYVASGNIVDLNTDVEGADGEQTGDIIFTGKYTETHLNEALAAAGENRKATEQEILNSRTSYVYAMTNLYGGRLRVEEGAIYQGHGITAHAGSASTVRVKDATLNHEGYNLTFNAGTTLELAGANTITGNVQMLEGSTLSFDGSETKGVSTLNGSLSFTGGINISLDSAADWSGDNELLLIVDGALSGWDENSLTIRNGESNAADIRWINGDLLVLNYNKETFKPYFRGDYASASRHSGDLNLKYYNSVSFEKFDSDIDGGAINGSTITLSYNESVTFSGNTVSGGSLAWGGAINGYETTMIGNGNVTFSGNKVCDTETASIGGAISARVMLLCENVSVTFIGNTAESIRASAEGGAIAGQPVILSNNGSVAFIGNMVASSSSTALGGAIVGGYTDDVVLSNNGSVTFNGNTAMGALGASGGAIDVSGYSGADVILVDNGSVTFCGNTAESSSLAEGGAIYMYNDVDLSIRNNDSVEFYQNAEVVNGNYRLRSIYADGGGDNVMSFSAASGKSIIFRDSIHIGSGYILELNEAYEGKAQQGDILFTGATTVDDLYEVKGDVAGTELEILASRTSEVYTMTNLYGGRLRVEDGAIYQGQGITVHEDSEATVRVKDAELSHVGYELEFNAGTALEVAGESTIRGQVNLKEDSVFKLELGAVLSLHETAGDDAATLSVSGTALLSGTSTLNASLTLLDGSTLDMDNLAAGAVTLNGALTFGEQVTIGENLLALLEDIKAQTEGMVLFTGIDSLTLPDVATTTASARTWAGSVFSNLTGQNYYLVYKADTGTLSIVYNVPEPATATLSLLALAALAARRRRK